MNLRSFLLTDNDYSDLTKRIFHTFSWLYENSPINFATLTGWAHPSVPRLTGNIFFGRAGKFADPLGLAREIESLGELAKTNSLGRAYLNILSFPTILLTRPEDIAQILAYNSDKVDRGKLLEVFGQVFGEHNLLTQPTDANWAQKRAKLQEWVLTNEKLDALVPEMQKIVDEFVAKMAENNGNVINLEKSLVALTMEIFARTQLASDKMGENVENISKAFGAALGIASNPIHRLWMMFDYVFKCVNVRCTQHLDDAKIQLQQVLIENFIDPNKKNLQEKENILQNYFRKYFNNTAKIDMSSAANTINQSDSETIDDLGLLLLAGHETTSRLLQFTIILLSKHPDVLARVIAEIAANKPADGSWTKEHLNQLDYLTKVLKETLRLFPPTPVIPRKVTKTIILGDIPICISREEYHKAMEDRDYTKDIILHPNSCVMISPWITQRLESHYDKPLEFNPDRHETSSMYTQGEFTWIPFGVGDRNCPGRRFAIQEVLITLVRFLETYNFKPGCEKGQLLETYILGTLKHKEPVDMQVSMRK